MKQSILALLVSAMILLGGENFHRPGLCRAEDAATADSDSVTVVIFAPMRPILAKLRILIDGTTPEQFRARFVEQWFRELDTNKDGSLDETEVAALSVSGDDPNAQAATTWRTFDTSASDSKLTPAEFRTYADSVLGAKINVVSAAQTADRAAGLFSQLDADHDGALTKSELEKSRGALSAFDADDDETLSVGELNAAAKAAQTPAGDATASTAATIVLVDARNTPETVAEQLLRRYDNATVGSEKPQPADGALDPAELGLSAEVCQPFDRDSNGKLDAGELARLIVEPPPRLALSTDLFDVRRGVPSVRASALGDEKIDIKAASSDVATLSMSGFEIGIRADRTRSSTGDSQRYYTVRFKLIDKDKNGYLDAKEFAALGLPEATFEAVDGDKNNQVVENEVLDFLARGKSVRVNQIIMRVTDESRPLFNLLDTREDSRLSIRELNSAAERLKEVDNSKDGKITRAELTTKIAVDWSVKRPPAARTDMRVMMAQPARAVVVPRESGPDWFLRMDRNYDGDVSWREFLGPRKVFDRLDTDHDELLSPEEANHAE